MDEELDYISSSPLVGAKREVKPQDEIDLPALERVAKLMGDQLALYDSISSLNLRDDKLSVEQQLAISEQMKIRLSEIKVLVDTTIENVREIHRHG